MDRPLDVERVFRDRQYGAFRAERRTRHRGFFRNECFFRFVRASRRIAGDQTGTEEDNNLRYGHHDRQFLLCLFCQIVFGPDRFDGHLRVGYGTVLAVSYPFFLSLLPEGIPPDLSDSIMPVRTEHCSSVRSLGDLWSTISGTRPFSTGQPRSCWRGSSLTLSCAIPKGA